MTVYYGYNKDIECSVNWLLKFAYGADNANGEGKEQFIKEYLLKKAEAQNHPSDFPASDYIVYDEQTAENKYNYLRRCNIVCLLYELEKLDETTFCPLCHSTNKEEAESCEE